MLLILLLLLLLLILLLLLLLFLPPVEEEVRQGQTGRVEVGPFGHLPKTLSDSVIH